MRFGRALLIGLAGGLERWQTENERRRELMEKYRLLEMQQRANRMLQDRDHQLRQRQIQQEYGYKIALEGAKAEQEAAKQQQYYQSPEWDLEKKKLEAEIQRLESVAEKNRRDLEKDNDKELSRDQARYKFLENMLKSLEETETDNLGRKTTRIPPKYQAQAESIRAEIDTIRQKHAPAYVPKAGDSSPFTLGRSTAAPMAPGRMIGQPIPPTQQANVFPMQAEPAALPVVGGSMNGGGGGAGFGTTDAPGAINEDPLGIRVMS